MLSLVSSGVEEFHGIIQAILLSQSLKKNELVHCLGNKEPYFSENVVDLSLLPLLDVSRDA